MWVLRKGDKMTKDKTQESGEIYSSTNLHEKLNQERRKEGKYNLPAVNPLGGTNRNYSDKDKSFTNVADFFVKLHKREKVKKEEEKDDK